MTTSNIPLSPTKVLSLMEGQLLRTDQIITALEIIGNPKSHPAIIVDDALCTKLALTVAVFPDLEPPSAISWGCCCIANSFHINCARTLVTRIEAAWLGSIRPSSPKKADFGSSSNWTSSCHRGRSINVARHIIGVNVGHWIGVWRNPHALPGPLIHAVDEHVCNHIMCRN